MPGFQELFVPDYERVIRSTNQYDVIVAIHSTKLGPALGGCRLRTYPNKVDALSDALRLAEGMTYKNSLAGLDFGGGKAVINLQPGQDRQEALSVLGELINELSGAYITAEDVGTNLGDLTYLRTITEHTEALKNPVDPSHMTALGVFRAMEATIRHADNWNSLKGVRVGVLGIGKVGFELCRLLHAEGAQLAVADIDTGRAEFIGRQFGAYVVSVGELHKLSLDVFAPCALGEVISPKTIPELGARSIVGSANNQLTNDDAGFQLYSRGILYAPDFLANAGGVITVASQIKQPNDVAYIQGCVSDIYGTLLEVYTNSRKWGVPTHKIAEDMAKARLVGHATNQ